MKLSRILGLLIALMFVMAFMVGCGTKEVNETEEVEVEVQVDNATYVTIIIEGDGIRIEKEEVELSDLTDALFLND